MTAPSNPLGDEWGRGLHVVHDLGQIGRMQALRMSRHFAEVGVGIPAARLREIASGARVDTDEWVDVEFGLAASEIKRQQRMAKIARGRRRCTRWLIFAGMVLVALNALMCMACVLFTFMEHGSAF